MSKIKIVLGIDEFDIAALEPKIAFVSVNCRNGKLTNYQHLIKNRTDPDFWLTQHSDGSIENE